MLRDMEVAKVTELNKYPNTNTLVWKAETKSGRVYTGKVQMSASKWMKKDKKILVEIHDYDGEMVYEPSPI